jgi:hypothetical protein
MASMTTTTTVPTITPKDHARARMFGIKLPTPAPAPTRLPTPKPATGKCSLRLSIRGTTYRVTPLRPEKFSAIKALRLRKADGTTYDVSQHVHGCECDCPDFVFHRDGIDPAGCKHIRSCRACGLID